MAEEPKNRTKKEDVERLQNRCQQLEVVLRDCNMFVWLLGNDRDLNSADKWNNQRLSVLEKGEGIK